MTRTIEWQTHKNLITKTVPVPDMTNTDGQLYTIEGFAAGLIMIMTAYLVVNATSVYTAGDTHISDMQLEALGSDALTMMGTPTDTTMYLSNTSPLRMIIENLMMRRTFRAMFLNLTNNRTGAAHGLQQGQFDDGLYPV